MDDFKRQYGLTNHEIAQGVSSLSDDDFLEMFMLLYLEQNPKGSFDNDIDEICRWLNKTLHEIDENNRK